jgi:hypothetical protein
MAFNRMGRTPLPVLRERFAMDVPVLGFATELINSWNTTV